MTESTTESRHTFEATTARFEADVLDASFDTPILVDLWSPRSATSQSLGPLLEKVVTGFHGSLRLARVNVDAEPRIAAMFQIRNVPTVILVSQGQPLDGFAGALDEAQLVEFLGRHVQPGLPPIEDSATEPAKETTEDAIARLRAEIDAAPDKPELRLDLAVALMQDGDSDAASALLDTLPANLETDDRARRLRAQLDFARALVGAPSADVLKARVAANAADHEARDLLGVRLLIDGDAAAALEQFLEILRNDRHWNEDAARKRLVAAFGVIDDADLVGACRRRMSSLLF